MFATKVFNDLMPCKFIIKVKKHLNNLNTYLENQRLSENFSGQIEPEEASELTEGIISINDQCN